MSSSDFVTSTEGCLGDDSRAAAGRVQEHAIRRARAQHLGELPREKGERWGHPEGEKEVRDGGSREGV